MTTAVTSVAKRASSPRKRGMAMGMGWSVPWVMSISSGPSLLAPGVPGEVFDPC
jgi:hypothetical protein